LRSENLFAHIPANIDRELFETLLNTRTFKLERILSCGQATREGEWYDQGSAEWVILLQGCAGLRFADSPEIVELKPGDYLTIPAHTKHRVEWTDTQQPTVWLALHFTDAPHQTT